MKNSQTLILRGSLLFRAFLLQAMLLLFFTTISHAQTICNNETGSHGGFTYEYWKSRGNGCMTLKSGGGFTVDWNDVGNLLARKAKRPGSFNQVVSYDVDFNPDTNGGRSFVSVYGWTQNPLIEYYIVEAWSHSRPTKGTRLGTIYSDGSEYDLYRTQRVNKPSIEGTKTFYQYWSVRKTKRTSGTVTTANHFNGWKDVGLELGSLWEVSLVIEALKDSAGFADVKSMSMTVGTSSYKDDIVSVSAPSSVERGKNVSINVNYSASTNRDIIAVFQLDQSPWTTYASQKKDVSAGSGTLTFNFNIPSDTPVANDKYQFQTFITTNNGGWDNRLDNIAKANVDVVNGGSGPGDELSEGVYRFQNASTNQFMDSDGNGMVRVNNSNGNPDQEWGLHATSGGYYNIDNRHNGRGLLDTDPNGVVKWSTAGPTNNNNEGFQWKPIKLSNGNYRFENRIGGRKYLRYNGNNRVVGYSNTADKRSEWKLTRVGGLNKANVSEELNENTSIAILPNPAVSNFEIRLSGLKNTSVSILNMQGQLLGKYLVTDNQLSLDASNWSAGVYFVNAVDESGTRISNKFMVK